MVKTNFTKVESAVEAGMLQLQVKNWLELAILAEGKTEEEKKNPVRVYQARKAILNVLRHELNFLYKSDPKIYETLGIERPMLFALIDHPDKIEDADWEFVRTIKEKVDKLRETLKAAATPEKNEKMVEEQRKKHINKRFNVNDKWLPLR